MCKQGHDNTDKNKRAAGGGAGRTGSSLAGDSPVSPAQGAGGDVGEGGGNAGREVCSGASCKAQSSRAADFHTSHARRRSPLHLPPKPGESPRRSYAIVGKSSNCRDNATGVTHASTESCGIRLEITHMHIYRACLRFNPFQHGAQSHRSFPMSPSSRTPQPSLRSMHARSLSWKSPASLLEVALGASAK